MGKEAHVLGEVRLYLGRTEDVMLIRINTGKFRPIKGPQDRIITSAPAGTPDLLGLMRLRGAYGVPLAIETKGRGRQSEAQKNFQIAWERRGGVYILAKSLQDVIKRLNLIRAPVPEAAPSEA